MANTPSTPATGNTPTGNPGAGRTETSSAPTPVATNTPASPEIGTGTAPVAPTGSTGAVDTSSADLSAADFKQDGTLRKDAIRRIEETSAPRGGSRSYNEVTDETTVVTTIGGQSVSFTESGDTRGEESR